VGGQGWARGAFHPHRTRSLAGVGRHQDPSLANPPGPPSVTTAPNGVSAGTSGRAWARVGVTYCIGSGFHPSRPWFHTRGWLLAGVTLQSKGENIPSPDPTANSFSPF